MAFLERRLIDLEKRLPSHVVAATATADIAAEAAARLAADGVLTAAVADEEAARIAADGVLATAISDEATARADADTLLDGRLTTAEADIDALQLEASDLATGLLDETNDRIAGDTALDAAKVDKTTVVQGVSGLSGGGALSSPIINISPVISVPVPVFPDVSPGGGTGTALALAAHQHGLATYAATPAAVGAATGSAGTSGTAPARGDHAHALTPADATHAGGIAASGSQPVGAQLQLPAGSTVAPYESWVNLTLNTNWSVWTTFGANYGFARYRRDALGHVELEVQVRYVGSGTAAWSGSIGSLPSGYRPQVKHRVCADSGRSSGANDSYCSIDIDNITGNLTVINSQQNSGTTYTWVCFHARFRSDT